MRAKINGANREKLKTSYKIVFLHFLNEHRLALIAPYRTLSIEQSIIGIWKSDFIHSWQLKIILTPSYFILNFITIYF